ncbi:SsgA family sporulation/cell division regulator [Kitasatospora sp. NPDC054939]
MHPAPVEQTVQARLAVTTHRWVRLRTTLQYRADDPLAVRMFFPAEYALDEAGPDAEDGAAADIEWVFGRRLLAVGLEQPAGIGDVHVRPLPGRRTAVELHTPEGTALLQFDTVDLRRFLWHSRLAVPEGEEHRYLDADRALADLLGQH